MFLHYYRVKRRLRYVGPKYLSAAAESYKDMDDPHEDAEPSSDMAGVESTMNTPVDDEGGRVQLEEFPPPRTQVCRGAILCCLLTDRFGKMEPMDAILNYILDMVRLLYLTYLFMSGSIH